MNLTLARVGPDAKGFRREPWRRAAFPGGRTRLTVTPDDLRRRPPGHRMTAGTSALPPIRTHPPETRVFRPDGRRRDQSGATKVSTVTGPTRRIPRGPDWPSFGETGRRDRPQSDGVPDSFAFRCCRIRALSRSGNDTRPNPSFRGRPPWRSCGKAPEGVWNHTPPSKHGLAPDSRRTQWQADGIDG